VGVLWLGSHDPWCKEGAMTVTRFAPSPTGPLHLGHAYSAVRAHDAARAVGGQFRLRIDDIDRGRSRAEWLSAIDADLAWLGLSIDGPLVVQSAEVSRHAAARDRLQGAGLLYPCFCTRAQIAAEIAASASAPHGPDGPAYPGTCRHLSANETGGRLARGERPAWRLDMARAMAAAGPLRWLDEQAGEVAVDGVAGDIVLWRRDDGPAYHLASTVDDAAMAVTTIVRGLDLFAATHVHRLLQALLDLPVPAYHHHRLIAGADGRRLAKRDDAASLGSLRVLWPDGRALADALRRGELPPSYRWVD
jgi:glutamyl-Q tRNA(Asp) synthetase